MKCIIHNKNKNQKNMNRRDYIKITQPIIGLITLFGCESLFMYNILSRNSLMEPILLQFYSLLNYDFLLYQGERAQSGGRIVGFIPFHRYSHYLKYKQLYSGF